MNTTKILAAVAAMATATSAVASSITVDSVAQRWPWNNKIDITYTVSGGQDVAAGVFARIVFTAHVGGTDYTIDGVSDVGASASDGQHTVTWTAPTGIRASGCTVTAQLFSADNPSGDDYMVVDLETGAVSYEGLLASQDASNARYNSDNSYKTNKLVLRKVPAWGARASLPNAADLSDLDGYPTGMDDANDGASSTETLKNSRAYWQTARDYYIGVFQVTQMQYKTITGSNPSSMWIDLGPVYKIAWNAIRGDATAPSDRIPPVSSFTGTFFQRLNFRTGRYFDLPTELTWEIAARAGATTTFPWGASSSDMGNYVVTRGDTGGNSPAKVGTKLPNDWGFYDMIGNILELCLDDDSISNLSDAVDPFAPASGSGAKRIARGGAIYNEWNKSINLRPSRRRTEVPASDAWGQHGFRVAFIVP